MGCHLSNLISIDVVVIVFAEDMVGGVVSLSGMTVEIMAVPVLSCIDQYFGVQSQSVSNHYQDLISYQM